jgi:hypothetical protein
VSKTQRHRAGAAAAAYGPGIRGAVAPDVDLKHLRYFLAVADAGTFTAAAETAYWTGTDLAHHDWLPGPVVHDAAQFVGTIRLGRGVAFLARPPAPARAAGRRDQRRAGHRPLAQRVADRVARYRDVARPGEVRAARHLVRPLYAAELTVGNGSSTVTTRGVA